MPKITDFSKIVVEETGEFKLLYGYNSSMDILNVIGALEQKNISAEEVNKVLHKMMGASIPANKLANYLACYYKLFGED